MKFFKHNFPNFTITFLVYSLKEICKNKVHLAHLLISDNKDLQACISFG